MPVNEEAPEMLTPVLILANEVFATNVSGDPVTSPSDAADLISSHYGKYLDIPGTPPSPARLIRTAAEWRGSTSPGVASSRR